MKSRGWRWWASATRIGGFVVTLFELLTVVALFALSTTAPARADAPVRHLAFAVVVGNNRSLEHRRPDLHYADDDAAKYFAILQTIAPERVSLLADFDDDTARLFPETRSRALSPTRTELLRVGRQLAEQVHTAAAAGVQTDVYFIFAGHGDVDEGTGFIELADARFTSADLEQWLRAIPFTRAHVILDSCNSFFMLGARKPGGRYYGTSEDAARSLADRLPNVGVFLSTSAEGEAFEWSEIQSGVFSHVVRSGLMGAADANGDGAISYQELAAFVATATADVRNPNMRPHVFARGPGGRDNEPIVVAAPRVGARAFRLEDTAPMRIRLRDRDALPILDANEEAGQTLAIALPDRWADGAMVERLGAGTAGGSLQAFTLPDKASDLTLASLQPMDPRGAGRGPAEIFQNLFKRPFGPHAVAQYAAEAHNAAPDVYGVSREDAERMNLLLGQIEGAEHGQRMLSGYVSMGLGVFVGVVGGSLLEYSQSVHGAGNTGGLVWGSAYLGVGGLLAAWGAYSLAEPWSGELAALEYRAALRNGTDYAHAFAAAEARLHELQAREARRQWIVRGLGTLVLVASAAGVAYNEVVATSPIQRLEGRAIGGAGILLGATTIATSYLIESPLQRLTTIWEKDPGMLRLQPTVAPVAGGFTFGLVGRF